MVVLNSCVYGCFLTLCVYGYLTSCIYGCFKFMRL